MLYAGSSPALNSKNIKVMEEQKSDKIVAKPTTTKLGKNISGSIAMLEEISKNGMMPIAIIGFHPKVKNKIISCLFATFSDDSFTHQSMLDICASLLKNEGYEVTKPIKP